MNKQGGYKTMAKLKELKLNELIDLVKSYDWYIQDANEKNLYKDGWLPVCIEEYLNNEYAEINK